MDSFEKIFPDEMAQLWNDVYRGLRDLPPALCSPSPGVLRFSPEGNKAWFDFLSDHRKELTDPDFPVHLKGPWAKLEGYCARLALILQEIWFVIGDSDKEEIDKRSVLGAWALIDYFKSHAKRVYRRLSSSTDDKKSLHLVEWIKKHGGRCRVGDLISHGVNGIKKATEGVSALCDLDDRGYGYWDKKESTRGPKAKYFYLYPSEPSNPVS